MAADTAVADHQRITLRIPPGLHHRLIAEAERNGRSLNAEAVARLEAGQTDGAAPLTSSGIPPRAVLVRAAGFDALADAADDAAELS